MSSTPQTIRKTVLDMIVAATALNLSRADKLLPVKDATTPAAGIILTTETGEMLFLRRSQGSNHAGTWAFPGGHVEAGETTKQAACRELLEETGIVIDPLWLDDPVNTTPEFETFVLPVSEALAPTLNGEHTAFRWAKPTEAPDPLHPAVALLLGSDVTPAYEATAVSELTTDWITMDKGFFTPIEAGATRTLTPEGFMVCPAVGLARTGIQLYPSHELPGLQADTAGRITVERTEAEVFHPDTIASFEGKPVTMLHPQEFVNPENWRIHAVGHVQNVRRGTGKDRDLLLGDVVITDAAAVTYASNYLPDISCGYDAKYKQLAPGRASQHCIRGNHAALVPNGKAGDRCAVRDSDNLANPTLEYFNMGKHTAGRFAAISGHVHQFLASKGLRTEDASALVTRLEPHIGTLDADDDPPAATGDSKAVMDAISNLSKDVKSVMDWQAARDAKEDEEEKKAAKDAAEEEEKKKKEGGTEDTIIEAETAGATISLGKVWDGKTGDALRQEIATRAEILSPGLGVPTQDAARGNGGVVMANFMRSALQSCYTRDAGGKHCVEPFLMGNPVYTLKGYALAQAFHGASELMKKFNNNAAGSAIHNAAHKTADARGGQPVKTVTQGGSIVRSAADYAANLKAKRKEASA